jgi:hypothetical protein
VYPGSPSWWMRAEDASAGLGARLGLPFVAARWGVMPRRQSSWRSKVGRHHRGGGEPLMQPFSSRSVGI